MPQLVDVLGNPNGPAVPIVRYGTVLASPAPTAQICWVQFTLDEPPVDVPFLTSYVPVAGDKVAVLFSAAGGSMQGLVIGGRAGQSGNMVLNGNFYRAPALELPPINEPPYHWTRFSASGTPAVLCQVPYQAAMALTMNIFASAVGDTYAYSAAIPVAVGVTYEIRTMGHAATFVGSNMTVQTRIAWFTSADAVYPDFMSEDLIGTDSFVGFADQDIYHTANLAAPDTATHARIALRSNHTTATGGNMYWNEIVMLPA